MERLTPSLNSRLIAQQYLKHEMRKMFDNVNDSTVWQLLDSSIDCLLERQGEASFWKLVAAFAETWKHKHVFHILSSTKYLWQLRRILLTKLVLTGMSQTVDSYVIDLCARDPKKFLQAWHSDSEIREAILKTGLKSYPERDHFPIIVYEEEGLRVIDGMRRALVNLIKGRQYIQAWVGKEVNLKGRSLVTPEHCHFLTKLYDRSEQESPDLGIALARMAKEIVKQYRNGAEVLTNRIATWDENKILKRLLLEELQKR